MTLAAGLETLRSSLPAGVRLLRTSPAVALTAVVALSMGIGFTTAMFGIVRGAIRPLPAAEPEEIVAIQKTAGRGVARDLSSYAFDLATWSAAPGLESIGAFQTTAANLAGGGEPPERVSGALITPNAFSIIGYLPSLGRGLVAGDAGRGAPPVVILSDTLWKRRYAADPGLVGRAIRVDGRPHTVIGIMPPRVGFPINASLWLPLPLPDPAQPAAGPALTVFARLRDGVEPSAARTELETMTSAIAAQYPSSHAGIGVQVVPFTEIETPREIVRGLMLLVVAVSFVLLIACGNVASLLVVRGAARAREIATRIALGAGRGQLVAEQLAESLTLSVLASLIGLAMAQAALRAFGAGTSNIIEAFWVDFRVDGLVVAFASGLAALATAAAGLGPALRISRTDAIEVLKDRSHGSSAARLGRISRRLPAAQIAMACGLLALTLVLAREAVTLRTRAWPFEADRILSAQYGLTAETLADAAARNRVMTDLVTGLAAQPGVEAAALTSALPGRGSGEWGISLDAPVESGRPAPYTTAATFVTPGYFEVLGARVLAGRGLTWQDDAAAPAVAVVSEAFVRRFSPDRDPLGRRVFLGSRALTIVGIVPDLMPRDIQERRTDGLFASILQFRPFAVRVVARGAGDPATLAPLLRQATGRVDADLPLYEVFTVREAALRDKAVLEVLSSLFLLFGSGALGLTAVGLYSVVAFAVALRTREFGIRLALGATRADIARLVAAQGGTQIAVGLATGIALAIGLTRAFAAAVEGAPAGDGQVLLVIVAAVSATAAAAMAVPARRATSIEIVAALKSE
jgi:predicted permease